MRSYQLNVGERAKKIEPFRETSLELADLAANICKECGIKYTLLTRALWGAAECKGYLPWSSGIQIGMFYNDFKKFIEVCKTKLKGTQYYIIDSDNCEQFEEVYVRLAKRSRVILPEHRKKDEIYYDYYIDIIPIFYAGNTRKEYRKVYKGYRYYKRCLSAFKILPDTVKLKNLLHMMKRAYYYKRRSQNCYDRMQKCLLRYNDAPTKYVILPYMSKQKGIVRLAETYNNLEEVTFEGHKYTAVRDAMQWVEDFYGKKKMKYLSETPVNQATLEGPELLRRIQLIELEMLLEFDRICRKHNLKYTLAWGTLLGAIRHGGFIPWDDDVDVLMLYEDYRRFLEIAPQELDTEKFFLRTIETDKDCNLTFAQIKRNNTVFLRAGRENYNTHKGVFMDILPLFNGSKSTVVHYFQHKICRFFKTMTWAHMGANSERNPIKRWYYLQLARVPNNKSYSLFLKFATMIKEKSENLAYLSVVRNPKCKAITKRSNYEDLIEVDFEGHSFYAPKNYDEILRYAYSDDYLRYPSLFARHAKHLPGVIDIGDLYRF